MMACLTPKARYPWLTSEPLYVATHEVVSDPLKARFGLSFTPLALGDVLPDIVLSLSVNRFVTLKLRLEESYAATCRSLRISI